MNKLTELAKQFLAYNTERDECYKAEDYDGAVECECSQRDIGSELALLILSNEPTDHKEN